MTGKDISNLQAFFCIVMAWWVMKQVFRVHLLHCNDMVGYDASIFLHDSLQIKQTFACCYSFTCCFLNSGMMFYTSHMRVSFQGAVGNGNLPSSSSWPSVLLPLQGSYFLEKRRHQMHRSIILHHQNLLLYLFHLDYHSRYQQIKLIN